MVMSLPIVELLVKLGYLVNDGKHSGDIVTNAIKAFQRFYGLVEDGEVGKVTERVMTDRILLGCGCPDIQQAGTSLCKWPDGKVSYYVQSTPRGLTPDEAKACYRRAWQSWEKVCGIKVIELSTPTGANVIISTGRGNRAGFDGPMGVLAWSGLPCGARPDTQLQQLYDLDEKFGLTTAGGAILLEVVARHEIGHALGISHIPASQARALMNPIYSPNVASLLAADIAEGVLRYGQASPSAPVPNPTPVPTPPGGQVVITIPASAGIITSVNLNGKVFSL